MVKLGYLDPFEVYRTTPPFIMPEIQSSRKKGTGYMIVAPSIQDEFKFLTTQKTLSFRNLYRYFIPKRWRVSLYGQGNKIIKLNEDGEVSELLAKASTETTSLKNVQEVTSYLDTYSGRPMRDFNVLLEGNYIFDTILNNPKDHRKLRVKVTNAFNHFSELYAALKPDGYLGNYTNRMIVIPTALWITSDELTNPDALMKPLSTNPMGHFLTLLCDKNNLNKFDKIILTDENIVMILDPAQFPEKEADTFIHDCIRQYLVKVRNVRHGDDSSEESVIPAPTKTIAPRTIEHAETTLAKAEQQTKEDVIVDKVLEKAKVDPDTVSPTKKDEIKKAVTKQTKTSEDSPTVEPTIQDISDVTIPDVKLDDIPVSYSDVDTIMSAKIDNRSIASQKRNELLKEKYKELKIGEIPLQQALQAEEKYEIPVIPIKSHTINESMKKIRAYEFERTYNQNIMQYDFANILLHFSTVSPALYLNKDIKIEDASSPTDRVIKYSVEFEDEDRKRHRFSFLMPKMYRDKYLYLNDQQLNISHQKFPYPITKTAPDMCLFTTNYNKIFTSRYGTNLSPRVTKIKKVFSGTDCPSSIRIDKGDGTIPNQTYLTTVEYDDLASSMVRIQMGKTSDEILTIYFIVDEASAVISIEHAPREIEITTYGSDGSLIVSKTQDQTLFPLAVKRNRSKKLSTYYFISSKTNRVYDSTGKDYGELSDFIVESAYSVAPKLAEVFDGTSAGTKFVFARSRILKKDIPTVLVAGAADPGGLTSVMDKAKIKYAFYESRPKINKDVTGIIPFEDGYLTYDRYPYENSLLLNGLLVVPTKEYKFYDLNTRDAYVEIFDTMFDRRNLIDGISNFYYLMIDPITKDVLSKLNMPTDFTRCLLYCVGMLADNTYQLDSSYENSRIRSNEIINAYLYKILATAWEHWRTGRADKFSIQENAVILALMQEQIVDPHSVLSVSLEAETDNQVKVKGPSGMNESHSFTLEKRAYHPSMRGVVAMNTTPSGEVGISRHLTMNANIDDARGFITIEKDSYDGTELTSIAELLQTFGPESADIERVAMAINQSKQTVPVASRSPGLVTYDMERTLPYLSNDFAFRTKQAGKVVEIKDDLMIIQYSDGTYDDVDLSEHPDTNVDGGFCIMNKLDTDFKVGQKFAANEIIAYNKKFISDNDMFGDPCADVGCLARLVLESNGGVYEDSGYITDSLAHRLATKITQKKRVILSKFANIKYIAKAEQSVKASDPILMFDDTSDEFSSQFLASLADVQEDEDEIIATNAPIVSKVTGVVKHIDIFYTIPVEDMTPSMRKIVTEYNKSVKRREQTLSKYRNIYDANTVLKPADKLEADQNGKVKGVRVGDGLIIDFYIEYDDVVASGDKLSQFAALKMVNSFVIPDKYAPYAESNPDRKIDAALATIGMYKRMCLDIIKVGGITKFLIEMKRVHKNKYADRIKAELKKK